MNNYGEELNNLILTNGETDIMRRFINKGAIVFDVGANIGDWSNNLLRIQSDLKIHTFEPVTETNNILHYRLAQHIKTGVVIPNCCGIGREVGQCSFTFYRAASSWSSLYRRERIEKEYGLKEIKEITVPVVTIDSYCENNRIEHVDFLKIDTEGGGLDVLLGAQRMLKWGKIDHIQFEYEGTYLDAGITLHEIFSLLDSDRYAIFKIMPESLEYCPVYRKDLENFEYASYLAVNERLLPTYLGLPPKMLNLRALFLKHRVKPRGVIHIGAHEGAELKQYIEMGVERVLFIEANPETYEKLSNTVGNTPGVVTAQCAITDHDGTITLHVTSMDQSSSILNLKRHREIYPTIVEEKAVVVPCRTLDTLLAELNLDPANYNVMNIDVQGAELLALKGAMNSLFHIEAINSEVNFEELYEGCAKIWELDAYLDKQGFDRVATITPYHPSWGDGLYVKRPLLTMSTLGVNGRFANQLFQYAFLRLYALKNQLCYQVKPWIGQYLFGHDDPQITITLPQYCEESSLLTETSIPFLKETLKNVDLWGYFQYHTSYYAPFKDYFRSLFQPVPELAQAMDAGYNTLAGMGKTIVGLHLRRGDYGYDDFFIAPSSWYLAWLSEIWPTLDAPVLFIASDEPEKVLGDFAAYHPITSQKLGLFLDGADFYPDFYLLSRCDFVAISNSSFSFAACMLNRTGKVFMRPSLFDRRLIPFDPWNSEVLLREHIDSSDLPVQTDISPTFCKSLGPIVSLGEVCKIKILLVYAIRPEFGKITLPEWIKEALQKYYFEEVQVYACGPNNEIDIPDSSLFYVQVEQVVQELQIDVVFDIDGWVLSEEFMFRRFPDAVTVPKVYWAVDTHQFLELQREKAQHFDLVYSAQKSAVSTFGVNSRWLPAGASLHEVDMEVERDIPIGFIGNIFSGAHERRRQIFEKVKEIYPDFVCATNIFLEDKAALTSRMKIVINVCLNNDINFRVFETLACGAMLITDKITDNGIEDLFEDGKHLVLFDDAADLLRKINYYLSHDDERQRIANAGKQLVLEKLTHRKLLRSVVDTFKLLTNNRLDIGEKQYARSCWCNHGVLSKSVHAGYAVCSSCGTQISQTPLASDDLAKFYSFDGYWKEHQKKLAGYPPIEVRATADFSDRIPFWYSLVEKYTNIPISLLEIGCSHGGFLAFCHSKGIETVVGVEVDEDTCRFARDTFELKYVVSGLFPDVQLPFATYDVITGFDVIEHFADPVNAILNINKLLADDGIFIFQTPCYRGEDSSWQQFKPEEHLYLFSEQNVKTLFSKCNLDIIDILPGYFPDDMFVIGKKMKEKCVLLLRTDAIGDNVLASSMLPYIHQKFEHARLVLVCQDRVAPLYESCPYFDEVLSYSLIDLCYHEAYRQDFEKRINAQKPNLLINIVYSRDYQNYYLSSLCNVSQKIAIDGDSSNILSDIKVEFDRCFTSIVSNAPECRMELERHAHFLRAIGIHVPKLRPLVWLAKRDYEFAETLFHNLNLMPEKTLIVFPGASTDKKKYSYFHKVLRGLYGYTLLMLGGGDDEQYCDGLCASYSGRAFNLAGKTSILQMAAVMSKARLYVGVDTSGAHVACAVGLPNVVLLGGGHFGRFLPYSELTTAVCFPLTCYNCNWQCQHSRCHCVDDIRPDIIINAIKYALSFGKQVPTIFGQMRSEYSDSPLSLQSARLAEFVDVASLEIIEV